MHRLYTLMDMCENVCVGVALRPGNLRDRSALRNSFTCCHSDSGRGGGDDGGSSCGSGCGLH